MSVAVKICGLVDQEGVDAAIEGGANYLGLNFFEGSPRHVAPNVAATLLEDCPEEILRVGLFVDPTDELLDYVTRHVRLDYLQLHGKETPERVDEVRLGYGLPVMKVIGVANADDVALASAYENHADKLLFDAKPPPEADRPGGNATAFQWDLMKTYRGSLPWMLAGGLTASNLAQALAQSGAPAVDVASGVESAPGQKDPALVRAFLSAAKEAT
ncbi:MAG: phosphoribosylanthranilate isomerase [Rhodospirillaceae bacterium]|nr:phosphoribosylanthranilate isomerase [Rhodospirillaceae bacterium]